VSLPVDPLASSPAATLSRLAAGLLVPADKPAPLAVGTWGCLRRPADFQRVLGTAPRSKGPHFSVHHVPGRPSAPAKPASKRVSTDLSTGDAPICAPLVDECPAPVLEGRWLGLVVPKRHAKRAVTRTLIKRQMRSLMQQHASELASGLWVVRLRAPFDRLKFVSAASAPLRCAVRAELATLVQKAASRGLTRG
jgi:ribonuclease P protein component